MTSEMTTEQFTTPERPEIVEPVCPPAPSRRLRLESCEDAGLTPLSLSRDAALASHRGRGILAGDFIKPDPLLTRSETRTYLLTELERWLTGRIGNHASQVAMEFHEPAELSEYLTAGTWPAARLSVILHMLEEEAKLPLPRDYETRFHFVGAWAASVCSDYLHGYEPCTPAAVEATGFVKTDRLPSGRVIESFWNHSPFEALRNAPPLSDEAEAETDEDETDETDEDETDEADEEFEDVKGIDEHIDAMTISVSELLTSDFLVPGWAIVTGLSVMLVYAWTVAVALSLAKHC
jgi:hypothetical protein